MKKFLMFFLLCEFLFGGIGKFVLVKGDVEIIRDGQRIKATNEMEIQNKDTISTIGVAKAQIRFEDDTVVSLGKNTNLVINDYLFAQSNSKVDMGVDSGSFKVISGNAGKLARNNFKFKANSAVIGIRGTIFAGEVGIENKKDMIACVQGGITVNTNGVFKDVNAGQMVEVSNDKISNPVAIDSSKIETISSLDSDTINQNHEEEKKDNNKSNTNQKDNNKQTNKNVSKDIESIKKAKEEFNTAKQEYYKNENKNKNNNNNKNKDKNQNNKDKDKDNSNKNNQNGNSQGDKVMSDQQNKEEQVTDSLKALRGQEYYFKGEYKYRENDTTGKKEGQVSRINFATAERPTFEINKDPANGGNDSKFSDFYYIKGSSNIEKKQFKGNDGKLDFKHDGSQAKEVDWKKGEEEKNGYRKYESTEVVGRGEWQ